MHGCVKHRREAVAERSPQLLVGQRLDDGEHPIAAQ
jgi:hypothetical protein